MNRKEMTQHCQIIVIPEKHGWLKYDVHPSMSLLGQEW